MFEIKSSEESPKEKWSNLGYVPQVLKVELFRNLLSTYWIDNRSVAHRIRVRNVSRSIAVTVAQSYPNRMVFKINHDDGDVEHEHGEHYLDRR